MLSLTVPEKTQGICGTYATVPLNATVPLIVGSSPRIAINREDFPLPTGPVTANISPWLTKNVTFVKALLSSRLSHEAETRTIDSPFFPVSIFVGVLDTE